MNPHSIYEFPSIFRAVHMEADGEIAEETAFLQQVWSRHYRRPIRRVLDIAAGNSPHGQILARDGISVAAIDRSPTMIAAGIHESQGLDIRFYRRPIEKFSVPERSFDVAVFMSETFPVITENAAIGSHFRSVARLLKRGGLYCIDIDRHDGAGHVRKRTLWRRRKVRVDGTMVEIAEYHRPTPWYEACHSIYELNCRIHFSDRTVETRDLIPIRYYTPNILEFAAASSGCFRMVGCYTDYSFGEPLSRCDRRWLGVLRRV